MKFYTVDLKHEYFLFSFFYSTTSIRFVSPLLFRFYILYIFFRYYPVFCLSALFFFAFSEFYAIVWLFAWRSRLCDFRSVLNEMRHEYKLAHLKWNSFYLMVYTFFGACVITIIKICNASFLREITFHFDENVRWLHFKENSIQFYLTNTILHIKF